MKITRKFSASTLRRIARQYIDGQELNAIAAAHGLELSTLDRLRRQPAYIKNLGGRVVTAP